MVGASKILTVSYGTFSCTLEGFDDPFNTMRAIAEYFRDLAAEDRYFGAEPPQPDAAMLHRIAEREIQRRVEARVNDNGVVLRAGAVEPAAERAAKRAPAPALAPAPEPGVAERLAGLRRTAAAPPAAADAVEPAAEPAPRDAAIEEAAEAEPLPVVEEAVEEERLPAAAEAEPLPVVEAVAEPAPARPEATTAAAEVEPVAEPPLPVVEEAVEEERLPAAAEAEPALPDLPPAQPAPAGPAAPAELAEGMDIAALVATVQAAVPGERGATAPARPPVAAPAETGIETGAPDLAPPDLPLPEDLPDTTAELPEDRGTPATAEDEDAILLAELVAEPAPAAPVAAAPAEPAAPAAEPAPAALADSAAEKLRRARARVIKVRRTDLLAEPAPQTPPAPAPARPAPPPAATGLLTPEAEAELMRELAEAVGRSPAPPAPQAPQPEREGRAILAQRPADNEDRLLKQADTEMAGPENRRRLATIAHLKAAVAATVADLKNPPARPAEAPMDRYRLDLARIVRPARPVAERTNPLVLVSQQRIDTPAAPPPAEPGPIRPRRVTAGNLALVEPDDEGDAAENPNLFTPALGFADFARTTGATELPDLLEAAAAYVAAVEGRDSFTRPHLMRHVVAFRPDLAREDSLRAFGTLMRDGLIVKSRRGQFEIAAQSRYLAAARKLPR